MKVSVALCVLALIACASADCGCLKCNPNLSVVSPSYSPYKVIYRNENPNVPTVAPYKLQAAIPPATAPLFIPKEYDYQMQYFPLNTPYIGSAYEYGLQAAIPPPTGVHIPLQNLKAGIERVVMDAPASAFTCGTSICHNGGKPLLPTPTVAADALYRSDCGCRRPACSCNADRLAAKVYKPDIVEAGIYGTDLEAYTNDRLGPDALRADKLDDSDLLKLDRLDSGLYNSLKLDADLYRSDRCDSCGRSSCGCSCDDRLSLLDRLRYAQIPNPLGVVKNLVSNKFRRKRNVLGNTRIKRDILDAPMNFMFKFVPNLLRGPILHAIHTVQHNANPAVARARANANKHLVQANLARSKQKLKLHKTKTHSSQDIIKNLNHPTKSTNIYNRHQNLKGPVNPHIYSSKSPQKRNHQLKTGATDQVILSKHLKQVTPVGKHLRHNQENNFPNYFVMAKPTKNRYFVEEDEENIPSATKLWSRQPKLGSKYNIDDNEDRLDFVGKTNEFLREIFNALSGKSRSPSEKSRLNHQRQKTLEEIRNHLHRKGYSNEEMRDILLAKMKKFNESYERKKRSVSSFPKKLDNNTDDWVDHLEDEKHQTKNRTKRGVLLDSNQFQLPFFEIEDEIIDNYHSGNSEEVVGLKQKKKKLKRRRLFDDSDMESEEEILGASHPMHDHPFVVLLRTPLKLLHHFHDIRKNFQPILHSFPKILHSSRKYLKDFGKNLQTGVLDFASNIMGDFDNHLHRTPSSLFAPSRHRRSITDSENSIGNNEALLQRNKRYILKVVDEKEVQEFLEEKLGGFFGDDEEKDEDKDKDQDERKEEESEEEIEEERVGKAQTEKTGEKKFVVKKLSPKLILDNNGKPFIEINGNKRPLFFGKNKNKSPLLQKSKPKTHEPTSKIEKEEEESDEERKHDEINDKIDEVIAQAKQKLRDGEILKSVNCDEIPTQTIKEKINQISSYIQDLVSLDCTKYADLYENLSKLEKMRKSVTDYWKKVMINEKTNDIQCKIKILKYIREMQNEKDKTTKKIAEHLKEGDNFIVKKLIKLLVRLQKLQCLIQKIVDHFDNRMKIGTLSDTEKEIKFVDYLSSLTFDSSKSEDEFVCSLKKEKHDCLHREIQFLENLRLLLQKDDSYITNEVAKQIWEMRNIQKLQQGAIKDMNSKLEDNMKIRKELKILFDLLNQIEASEDACEKLLHKIGDNNIVGSKLMLRNSKRRIQRPSLEEILENIRNSRAALAARKRNSKT